MYRMADKWETFRHTCIYGKRQEITLLYVNHHLHKKICRKKEREREDKENKHVYVLVISISGNLIHQRGRRTPILVGEGLRHPLLNLRTGDDLILAVACIFGVDFLGIIRISIHSTDKWRESCHLRLVDHVLDAFKVDVWEGDIHALLLAQVLL